LQKTTLLLRLIDRFGCVNMQNM